MPSSVLLETEWPLATCDIDGRLGAALRVLWCDVFLPRYVGSVCSRKFKPDTCCRSSTRGYITRQEDKLFVGVLIYRLA